MCFAIVVENMYLFVHAFSYIALVSHGNPLYRGIEIGLPGSLLSRHWSNPQSCYIPWVSDQIWNIFNIIYPCPAKAMDTKMQIFPIARWRSEMELVVTCMVLFTTKSLQPDFFKKCNVLCIFIFYNASGKSHCGQKRASSANHVYNQSMRSLKITLVQD